MQSINIVDSTVYCESDLSVNYDIVIFPLYIEKVWNNAVSGSFIVGETEDIKSQNCMFNNHLFIEKNNYKRLIFEFNIKESQQVKGMLDAKY